MFYHPRDWFDDWYDAESQHENDIEGYLAIVKKGDQRLSTLTAILTVAHGGVYSYVPLGSRLRRNNVVFQGGAFNGTLRFQFYDGNLHPKTVQHSKGHGCYAFPSGDVSGASGQDGIVYYPAEHSEVPSSGNDRNVKYKLIEITSSRLWRQQLIEAARWQPTGMFAGWRTFRGDDSGGCGELRCPDNAAQAPWQWPFSNYRKYQGLLALDPIAIVSTYFSRLGNFDTKYVNNKYLSDLKAGRFHDARLPYGWSQNVSLNEALLRLR